MKRLYCVRCSVELGKMNKGKIKKNAVLLCADCNEKSKISESIVKNNHKDNYDMPDFMKSIFNK